MRRRRPLHEPRGVLETDARAYFPALAAGIAIGLLVLVVLLVVESRERPAARLPAPSSDRMILLPVDPVGEVPLGEFGACVQERLVASAPAGDETDADMAAAREGCLHLLGKRE